MDLFHKCRQLYSNPDYAKEVGWSLTPRQAEELGVYPFFIPIDHAEGSEVFIDGRKLIMLGSNNYLGMTTHPKVREAAMNAIKTYGTGCTGSRFLNGTLHIHNELEERLAKFIGKEDSIVFSTGFQVNLGSIPAIVSKDDIIIADKEVHASIIDGIMMAKVQKDITARFYKHNNMSSLEDLLQSYNNDRAKLVTVDGVFSMGGDLALLPDIVKLCKKYNARLLIDDAHSVGVIGGGRGTAAHFGCVEDVDLIVGTFSKSFASIGGFIAGSKEAIHWIKHFARAFIFSASLPPASVATVLAVLDIIEQEPERIEQVNKISDYVRSELKAMGYNTGESQTPIIPIIIGDQYKTLKAWRILFDAGIYTNVALPPAVPPNLSLLRTSYMSTHTEEQIDIVLTAFREIKEKIGN